MKEILEQFENIKMKFDKLHANETTKSGKLVKYIIYHLKILFRI
jgi:hypothetical protein